MDNQPHPYIILHPCYLKGNWKVRVIEVVILDCVAGKRSAAGVALGTSLGTATHTMAVCVPWMKIQKNHQMGVVPENGRFTSKNVSFVWGK